MNDRQLLELAANAAGYTGIRPSAFYADTYVVQTSEDEWTAWRPLTDDGDALRLAVKLGMSQNHSAAEQRLSIFFCDERSVPPKPIVHERYGDDPCAATRRAIVRAAAELGRAAS